MLHSQTGPREKAPLAVLLVGNFVTILDVFIVNIALPAIQRDLGASDAELQLIMVAYIVAYGAMLLNGARLGDLYGRRRVFLVGMAVFGIGSFLCATAASAWMLIFSRAIQGLGAALLMPQVYTSLRLLFEGDQRKRAFATMGGVQGIAGVASQTIGGGLMALNIWELGWRLVFLVNIPIAIYALLAGRWLMAETKAAVASRLDIVGAGLGAVALLSLLLPMLIGRELGWPIWTIVALFLSLPLMAIFLSYESWLVRCGRDPIINTALFGNMIFALGTAVAFLFYSAISSFSLSLTILLQVGLGKTALEAALLFLPSTVAFFLGSMFSAQLSKQLGSNALSLGMIVFAVGLMIGIGAACMDRLDDMAIQLCVILQGLGQGIVIPLLLNAILTAVPDAEAGMASGAMSVIQTAGSAFGVTVVGVLLFSAIDSGGADWARKETYVRAFATSTLWNAAAVITGVAMLLWVARLSRRKRGVAQVAS
jgi:MFS family permease